MQLLETLSIIRRRWLYVAIGLLAGVLAGFVTAPGASATADLYQATHRLLVDPSSGSGQALNLEQLELVVTTGAVPQRARAQLADDGQPPIDHINAVANKDLRSLDITAFSSTPGGAAAAADLLAQELNAELVSADRTVRDESLTAAQGQASSLESQLQALDQRLAGIAPDNPDRQALEDQRKDLASALSDAQAQVRAIQAQGGVQPPLRTLDKGHGIPAVTDGWRIPDSRLLRAAMLGVFGLLLGIGGALAADRLDTRVRNKEDAERSFGLPVVAEIPPLPSGAKGRQLLVATQPAAPFVEAYRALRTVVLFASERRDDPPASVDSNGNGTAYVNGSLADALDAHDAHVILITSPAAGEGKTTTVAHLSALLAEFGKRVLVVSADFRRPRVHELFGISREPGLSDVLEAGTHRIKLSDLQMSTAYAGVHLLPSGGPVINPARLLTETRALISAARSLFDYIVIDTPPLLVANDATELASVADLVLLMAKADRSSRDNARRSAEVLQRVDAPLLGVVLSAAHDTPTAYGYYRYRYYAEADQGGRRSWLFRRRGRAPGLEATEPTEPVEPVEPTEPSEPVGPSVTVGGGPGSSD